MKKILRGVHLLIYLLILLLLTSCGALLFFSDMLAPGGGNNNSALNINVDNAVAIAGTGDANRSLTGQRGASAKLTEDDEAALVKILEDGTIESILDFGDDQYSWKPNVSFMSIGDEGSIYIGFEGVYSYWTDQVITNLQFIRVYPDNQYDILWPPQATGNEDPYNSGYGQIDVWGWYGMDQDPLVRGADGKLYFKVSNHSSSGSSDSIYVYDPVTREFPEIVTPEEASLTISTFMVDKEGHLFIQSGYGWGDSEASYLRYYTIGETGFKNIYYSSDSDTWVRGYVTSPNGDYVVMNGNNIRSMNGIIKVNIINSQEVSYEILYSNANNNSNWINLYKNYNNSWENNTELIDQINDGWDSSAFEWRDDVKTADAVDINKIYTKIAPYFYDIPIVKSGNIVVFNDYSDTTGVATPFIDYITGPLGGYVEFDGVRKELWRWIASDSETFLTECFDGVLFKDWLVDNNLDELSFDNISTMIWASNGALYGLYDQSWWGNASDGTKVVKLLDSDGVRDLQVVGLSNGENKPSMIKIIGNVLYYRYAVLDSFGEETGLHKLANLNIVTNVEKELTPADVSDIEILSYDVTDDHSAIYFLGVNPMENTIINGRIDAELGTWELIESTVRLSNIKVIE